MTAAPRLEIHVPISPTPIFFTRIRYLAASLQLHGGALRDSPIVVTVGADQEPEDLHSKLPWSRHYPIEWRWMERSLYREHIYFATRLRRFTWDFRAANVMMLDADVLVVGPIADLIDHVERTDAFLGSPAHVSPVDARFTWEALFASAGLTRVPYVCEHTGFGVMYDDDARRFSPPYFNLGVLVAPAHLMRRIGETIFAEHDVVRRYNDFFRAQPSVTLAICRHAIPWGLMPIKYNFPNDQRFVARYAHDFGDLRLVHFLRREQIDKDAAFESPESIEALFGLTGLDEVNEAFLRRLAPIHDFVTRREGLLRDAASP